MTSRVDGVRVAARLARPRTTPPARPRRDAIATMLRAGMGKIPNYFKSAQKELLSLGGKLIDKMKEYDKDNIPAKIIDKIEAYIEMEAFTPVRVAAPSLH